MELAAKCLRQYLGRDLCSLVFKYAPQLGFTWAAVLQPTFDVVTTMTAFGDDMIATGMASGDIRVCSTSSGKTILNLVGHTLGITNLVDCGGAILASTACDCTMRIWHCKTRTCISIEKFAYKTQINLVRFPNGDLASVSNNQSGPMITIWGRADLCTRKVFSFKPWLLPDATLALQDTLVVADRLHSIVTFRAQDGVELARGTLAAEDPQKHNSQVGLLALTHSTVASIVDGYVDIWKSEGSNLTKLSCFRVLSASPCMAVSHGCLIIALDTDLQSRATLQICAETQANLALLPAARCSEIIVLPNNRVATRHEQTGCIHVWSLCL